MRIFPKLKIQILCLLLVCLAVPAFSQTTDNQIRDQIFDSHLAGDCEKAIDLSNKVKITEAKVPVGSCYTYLGYFELADEMFNSYYNDENLVRIKGLVKNYLIPLNQRLQQLESQRIAYWIVRTLLRFILWEANLSKITDEESRGFEAYWSGDCNEAILQFKQSKSLEPTSSITMAKCYIFMEDYQNAKEVLDSYQHSKNQAHSELVTFLLTYTDSMIFKTELLALPEPGTSPLQIAGWTSVGVGSSGLGIGLFFLIDSLDMKEDKVAGALYQKRYQDVSKVLLIGGGTLLVAGVVLLVLDSLDLKDKEEKNNDITLFPAVAEDHIGVFVGFEF